MATLQEKLILDPGIAPARNRRTSGCKCMLLVVGTLVSLLFSIGIAKIGSDLFYDLREPHSDLYQNEALSEVKDKTTVVRPLVDRYQKFDIVATVWVRTIDPGDDASGLYYNWVYEDPIFSNTVFRGVTLMDKHVHTKVNLSIPLETLAKVETLRNFDVRATFKLIPQSPSLLDYITSFTTWVPETVVLPEISPESHARKMSGGFSHPNTPEGLRDAALESFAISVPLIDFHPIKSECGQTSDVKTEDDGPPKFGTIPTPVQSTWRKSPLESHPYFVTRTDLRVARMDKLYNKRAYDVYQNRLRVDMHLNGCSMEWDGIRSGLKCFREFHTRGNCETRIELEVPDEKTGTSQNQTAYAPFLIATKGPWGPSDVVRMPVNRERCPVESVPEAPRYMHVTWNLAYSGSTPEKLLLADEIARANQGTLNATATEAEKARAQQLAEFMRRMHGNKYSPDNHVGRSVILDVTCFIINFVCLNLGLHYWYTRSTTVGISIIGPLLSSSGFTLSFALELWAQKVFREDKPLLSSLFVLVVATYRDILILIVILRAVLRMEVMGAKFSYLRLIPASHLERASMRLETKGRKWWIIGILVSVFTFTFVDTLRDLPLISRLGPAPDPLRGDLITINAIENYIIWPLYLSGTIFQVTLNHRSKTFAGRHKLTAWMVLTVRLTDLAAYIPWLAWRAGTIRSPYSLGGTVNLGLSLVFAMQAMIYPKVPQDVEDRNTS